MFFFRFLNKKPKNQKTDLYPWVLPHKVEWLDDNGELFRVLSPEEPPTKVNPPKVIRENKRTVRVELDT